MFRGRNEVKASALFRGLKGRGILTARLVPDMANIGTRRNPISATRRHLPVSVPARRETGPAASLPPQRLLRGGIFHDRSGKARDNSPPASLSVTAPASRETHPTAATLLRDPPYTSTANRDRSTG